MAWRPLLEGPIAGAARATARELALRAAAAPCSAVDRTLFWAYANLVLDEPFASEQYDRAIDELVAQVLAGARHPMLYNDGLAGMGWALAHVLDGDGDGLLPMIDEALHQVTSAVPWRGDFDLSQGLVGHGVYFLERLRGGDAPVARAGLVRVVAQLAATAERTADGARWHTAAERLPASHRARFPHGRHDCGLAHGTAGAIALLSRVADHTASPSGAAAGRALVPAGGHAGAAALCADAVRWLVAQRGPANAVGGRFPAFAHTGAPFEPSRAAWCYGDPGVALALWRAAPALALATARDCALRPPARCHVVDPALCHGSAGMLHLCNRFYQATGDTLFAEAARGWLAITLQAVPLWGAPPLALVDGALGVALALLAAVAPLEPAWDRFLMCDLPTGV